MFEIEKGVPIPAPQGGVKKYPLEEMDVGDSFLAPGKSMKSGLGSVFVRYRPKKFVTRKEGDGIRVWRIE